MQLQSFLVPLDNAAQLYMGGTTTVPRRFVFPEPKRLKPWAYGLIAVAIVVFLAVITAAVLIVFRQRFHCILVERNISPDSEWNNN